ncbi:hypothetical protein [Flavobacterium chungbukense]|uniref:Uncharacterized protein n=1 Tax=Flavobacterium chungbukense TaxID=877464 RepID=A0ABP7YDW8_9FLAO|nr:hypothetical protein [Flavobacterium chungbukense]MCC4920593.1 hypothetical protein [Flavobacterium chungbukense]
MVVLKKNMVKYDFLVFLYAYLRQIDLSLDRNRSIPLSKLAAYYDERIKPGKIANYLGNNIDCNKNQRFNPRRRSGFVTMIKGRLLTIFKKEAILSDEEKCYCKEKLLKLESLLSGDFGDDKFLAEEIRIEIAEFNYRIIGLRLKRSDRKKADAVEHFMQSDLVQTKELAEFLNFKV